MSANNKKNQLHHRSLRVPVEEIAEQEYLIEEVKSEMKKIGSTRDATANEIAKLKKSFTQKRTASSASTIFALTNSMVGSVCLVIPISFSSSGLIMSLIVMAIIGYISMKTCQLYLTHLREGETDLSDLISRTLGKKYSLFFNFCSSLLMFLVGNIYFLLINQTAYPMLCFLFQLFGLSSSAYVSQADMNSVVVFDSFSIQWLGMIVLVCVFPLFLIKNMNLIIKLAHGGFFAIGLYVCFVIYTFFDNLASGVLADNVSDVNYFSSDIASIAGSFALAFMVHNAIAQIMSQNAKPEKNERDMSVGYTLAACIYGLIGIFGSFGIVGRPHPANAYTITQYFDSDSVPPFIINLCFAGHLVTAFPLFLYVSKTQFFNLIYPNTVTPKLAVIGFNLVFASSCFLINMFNVNPGVVIGITGAVVGFVIVYYLPILIHLKCIHYVQKQPAEQYDQEQSGQSEQKKQYYNSSPAQQQQLNNNEEDENNMSSNLLSSNSNPSGNGFQCDKHPNLKTKNPVLRYVFYGIICGVGVYLAVIQLIDVFSS